MNAASPMGRSARLVAALLAVAMLAAACGSDDETTVAEAPSSADESSTDDGEAETTDEAAEDGDGEAMAAEDGSDEEGTGDATAFPVDVETANGTVTIEARPTSIVSLSPTATEILYSVGAGDRVVAVDLYSNYPAAAPEGTLDGFSPDLEAILAVAPDLVVASGLPDDVVAGLAGSGVGVLIQPAASSFDDTYDQIAQLGEATGMLDEAATLNAEIRSAIDVVMSTLPESEAPVRVFHEIDDSFYTASSNSFIGQVYAAMGFENIADPLDDGSGFPLVDGESIIAADPSLIVFTDQVPYSADDIAARPGWETLTAVTQGSIVQVDADIASRWGPRIVEFMQVIADAVAVDA